MNIMLVLCLNYVNMLVYLTAGAGTILIMMIIFIDLFGFGVLGFMTTTFSLRYVSLMVRSSYVVCD